jgi:predicted phosphoribosyltransferase
MSYLFKDRKQAGEQLAKTLCAYAEREDVLVLALPRGGVPVAYEVSKELSLPLDVWVVRKIGVPGHEEYAMGAIAMGDLGHINPDIARGLNIPEHLINKVIDKERKELARRHKIYREGRPQIELDKKTILIVDDGLATGSTMKAAIESLRHAGAEEIIVAVPVGASDTIKSIEKIADDVICLYMPEPFHSVGKWYENFSQTSDADVKEFLDDQALPFSMEKAS